MEYTYTLKYFKKSGKYYASGEFKSDKENMYEVFDEVRNSLQRGHRPGLVDGHSGFTAVLTDGNNPCFYPAAFIGEA